MHPDRNMETELLISMLACFLGSFICGLCGLGAAIIAMSFMILVLPVQTVAMISCLTALGLTCAMALQYMKYCQRHTVLWMALGGCARSPDRSAGPAERCRTGSGTGHRCAHHLLCGRHAVFPEQTADTGADGLLPACRLSGGFTGTCVTIDGPVVAIYGLLAG